MEVVVDGITYADESEAPDLGSLKSVRSVDRYREYEGFIADKAKLPTYVSHGSTALLYDGAGNTEVLKFNEPQKKWAVL